MKQKLNGAIASDAPLADSFAQVNLAYNALGAVDDQAQGLAPVDAAQDARDAQPFANHVMAQATSHEFWKLQVHFDYVMSSILICLISTCEDIISHFDIF